jgi:hypothetical protein
MKKLSPKTTENLFSLLAGGLSGSVITLGASVVGLAVGAISAPACGVMALGALVFAGSLTKASDIIRNNSEIDHFTPIKFKPVAATLGFGLTMTGALKAAFLASAIYGTEAPTAPAPVVSTTQCSELTQADFKTITQSHGFNCK